MTDTNDILITEQEPVDIDRYFHQMLAKHRRIAAIWCIADVKGVRPHLTDDQAWEVLEHVGRKHDADWGICWMTLTNVADDMFPQPDEE